jgi:hypothetical protein
MEAPSLGAIYMAQSRDDRPLAEAVFAPVVSALQSCFSQDPSRTIQQGRTK